MNQVTPVRGEAPITFGKVKQQLFADISNTRIGYPLAVILLAMGNIKVCFCFAWIHADLMGAFGFFADNLPYAWPQSTTPELGELRSWLLPMRSTLFLILRSSSMIELLFEIKYQVNHMSRSRERSSPNLEVGQWVSCGYFYLKILKFWWCHQWHVNRTLSCVSFILCRDSSTHDARTHTYAYVTLLTG